MSITNAHLVPEDVEPEDPEVKALIDNGEMIAGVIYGALHQDPDSRYQLAVSHGTFAGEKVAVLILSDESRATGTGTWGPALAVLLTPEQAKAIEPG